MQTRNIFHFPDGTTNHIIDLSYCESQFNIGEKIVIEDDPQVYIITDVQNQFRKSSSVLKMILRNVFLANHSTFPVVIES